MSQQWKELLEENSNNLEVALSLMDTSSIGKARYINNFNSLRKKLQSNLKEYVDINYQGFNSSIGLYRTVASTISNSQDNINNAKELLIRARADLATRRPVLKEMRATSLKYEKMINVLSTIEELKEVPDTLETQIGRKQFLSAYNTMSGAARKADSQDLTAIPAVNSIQSYLSNQESTLFSLLHDELDNHLYLKSPYCDSRWNSYSQARDDFNNLEQVIDDKVRFDLSEESTSYSGSSSLDQFLVAFDKDVAIENDERKNPEADSFYYIRLIVETCFKMNRLPNLLDLIFQNLPLELHKLIEKTIVEVRQRFPKLKDQNDSSKSKVNLFLEDDSESLVISSNSDGRLIVLKDLIWTLYSKLLAVLQGHRVIYEVVEGIAKRHHGRKQESEFLDYDFFKVYSKVEQEIKSILSSYVISKEELNEGKKYSYESKSGLLKKDPNVKLFRFNKMDTRRPEILKEYQALEKSLKKTVPGLVSGNFMHDPLADKTPFANLQGSSTHQLVVPPDVFNIRALIDPTVIFLQRSKAIFPFSDKSLLKKTDLFLESFLTETFLPQLTHALKFSFQQIMYGQETLKLHPQWSKHSKKPIQKGVLDFISLIYKSCRLLNTGVTYREKYAELLVAAINWMGELYGQYFNNIVTLQNDQLILGSELTADAQLLALSESLLNNPPTRTNETLEKEIKFFLTLRHVSKDTNDSKKKSITVSQLLEYEDFLSICLMAISLKWLIVRLHKLRKVRETDNSEDGGDSSNLQTSMKKRWTLLEASQAGQSIAIQSNTVTSELLILDGQSLKMFDKAVTNLETLVSRCIITLRNDIRCKTIYYLDCVMTKSDYYLDSEPEERDSYIGMLESTILKNNEIMNEYLLTNDKKYILLGLSQLMNELLIHGADNVSAMNLHGVRKMYLNIVVLQQMLKSIVVNPQQVDFLKAIKFYDILKQYNNSPTNLVKHLSVRRGFSYEECKILLRLTYNDIIRKHELANRKEAALTAKNSLQDALVKLHEVFWGSEKVSVKLTEVEGEVI